MTNEQYIRWRDFATRMARTAFRGRNARKVRDLVESFVIDLDEGSYIPIECIRNWDNSDPYPEGHPERRLEASGADWERWATPGPMCDAIDEFLDDASETLARNVRCCIRAGLGAAIDGGSGMGVMGFTAGDVRKMYPEGLPEWFARQWATSEAIGVAAVVPGVGFVPEPTGVHTAFSDLPDDAGVWL